MCSCPVHRHQKNNKLQFPLYNTHTKSCFADLHTPDIGIAWCANLSLMFLQISVAVTVLYVVMNMKNDLTHGLRCFLECCVLLECWHSAASGHIYVCGACIANGCKLVVSISSNDKGDTSIFNNNGKMWTKLAMLYQMR